MPRTSQDQSSLFLLHGLRSSADGDYVLETAVQTPAQEPRGAALFDLGIRRRLLGRERLADALNRAVTVPESRFFAEQSALDALVSLVMPALLTASRAARTLRIWSVGCGTGQPTQSLAMALSERHPELLNWNVAIVASDANADVLARARRGIYSDYEVQRGMPLERLERCLEPLPSGGGWRCRAPLSERISWLQLDPLESCSAVGLADVAFCHQQTGAGDLDLPARRRRLGRLIDQLAADGYLILPAAEPALECQPAFERLPIESVTIYRRVPRATSLLSA